MLKKQSQITISLWNMFILFWHNNEKICNKKKTNIKLKSNGFETVQFFIIFYKQNHLRNATKFLFILLFFNRS